jgi:crossover junction endodeoxyribonuclease RusA
MADRIEFAVLGTPEPQGSVKAFVVKGRPVITSDNPNLKSWRQDVATVALEKMAGKPPTEGVAVRVSLLFYFQRPKSIKENQNYKISNPDVDKLARSILDGLTSVCYSNDSQVVELLCRKSYGTPERVEIRVEWLA